MLKFGNEAVSRNILGQTDEDPSKYHAFNNNIFIDQNYWQSKVMLHFFMQYGNHLKKEFIQAFQKIEVVSYFQNLVECTVYYNCDCSLCFVIMLLTSIKNELPKVLPLSLGLCVYALSMKQNMSMIIHRIPSKNFWTIQLPKKYQNCIASIFKYVESIFHKAKHLSNYRKQYITNCMESGTTSPAESQNQIIHGHLAIQSNLNIEKRIESMMEILGRRTIGGKISV